MEKTCSSFLHIRQVWRNRINKGFPPYLSNLPIIQGGVILIKAEYEEYLESETWHRIRGSILKRDHYRCRICGSGHNLQVHHLWYPEVLGEETPESLVTLCQGCHQWVHREKEQRRKEAEKREMIKRDWIEEVKWRDFLYGGSENMCNLNILKSSAADYAADHHCDPPGVSRAQFALGYAHWLLTVEMYKYGFTSENIYQLTPLERTTINNYISKNRRIEEKEWNRHEYIPLEEIKVVVLKYIDDVEGLLI